MKNILIILSALCLGAAPAVVTFHQPDFTEAHYYASDSIWVVQEFNNGSAHTLIEGEAFASVCDYMNCTDSVATYWSGKPGDTISYRKRTTGYWVVYVNGKPNGKARVVTNDVVHTEMVDAVDEQGNDYVLQIEYLRSEIIDDIPRKISHDDRNH